MLTCLAVSLTLLAAAPSPSAGEVADSFEFRELARLPYNSHGCVSCGDADHDGLQELYALSRASPRYATIIEFTPDLQYDTICLPVEDAYLWFVSDLDRDGKAELGLDLALGDTFFLYESADSASLPLRLAWQAPIGQATPYPVVTDLDSDSALEVLLLNLGLGGLRVHENVGDNRYAFKGIISCSAPHTGGYGFNTTPDLDRDGLPELCWVDVGPYAAFYEAVADDSFALKSVCRLPLPDGNLWWGSVCGGPDIDGNGRTEAIVFAMHSEFGGLLAVLESPCNDSFEVVWYTYFSAGSGNAQRVAVGDVDGDGVPEVAVTTVGRVLLFRCTGVRQYEQFWQQGGVWQEVGLYDLNNDGRAEVICRTRGDSTVIYGYVSTSLAEQVRRRLEQVVVRPTVVGKGGIVRIAGMANDESSPHPSPYHGEGGRRPGEDGRVRVEVLDATGRCAEGCDKVVFSGGVAVWDTRGVVPGAYFIRVSSGSLSTTHKVLVLR